MKYKRRIMAGVFALSMLAGGSTVYASDFENLKASEYKTQVLMKSQNKDKKEEGKRKKVHKKFSSKLHESQV